MTEPPGSSQRVVDGVRIRIVRQPRPLGMSEGTPRWPPSAPGRQPCAPGRHFSAPGRQQGGFRAPQWQPNIQRSFESPSLPTRNLAVSEPLRQSGFPARMHPSLAQCIPPLDLSNLLSELRECRKRNITLARQLAEQEAQFISQNAQQASFIASLNARLKKEKQSKREMLKAQRQKSSAYSMQFRKPLKDLTACQARTRIAFLTSLVSRCISGDKGNGCTPKQARELLRMIFSRMNPKSFFIGYATVSAQLRVAKRFKLGCRSLFAVNALIRKCGGGAAPSHSVLAADREERQAIEQLYTLESKQLVVKSGAPLEECAVVSTVDTAALIDHVVKRVGIKQNYLPGEFAKEVWIGAAVDRGGKHSKMGVTVINSGLANSPYSFFPVCMHEGSESYENCQKTFKPIFDELQALKQMPIDNVIHDVRLFLTADGSALPCLSGHRGAAANFPCFLCEIHESQMPCAPAVSVRTHVSLARDFAKYGRLVSDFVKKRRREPKLQEISAISQNTNSVDCTTLQHIPLDQVVIPILHIRLGLIGELCCALEGLSLSQVARNHGAIGICLEGYKDCQKKVSELEKECEKRKKEWRKEVDELEDYRTIEAGLNRVIGARSTRDSQSQSHGHGLRSRSQTPIRSQTPLSSGKECAAGSECIADHIGRVHCAALLDESSIVCRDCKKAYHPICVGITSQDMLEKSLNRSLPPKRGRKRKVVDDNDYLCKFCHSNGKSAIQDIQTDLPSRVSKQEDEVAERLRRLQESEGAHRACEKALHENSKRALRDLLHSLSVPRSLPLKQLHGGLISKILTDSAIVRLDTLFRACDPDLVAKWDDLLACLKSWRFLEGFFKAEFYSDSAIDRYGEALNDFCTRFSNSLPHVGRMLKFHLLLCHSEPFFRKWKTLSVFCEQGIEHAHNVVNNLLNQFKFSYHGGALLRRVTIEMINKNILLSQDD